MRSFREIVLQGEAKDTILDEGVLRILEYLCVTHVDNLIPNIPTEAHNTKSSLHFGATKMYRDLRHYSLIKMKPDIVDFVIKCQTFNQVKYEYKKTRGIF